MVSREYLASGPSVADECQPGLRSVRLAEVGEGTQHRREGVLQVLYGVLHTVEAAARLSEVVLARLASRARNYHVLAVVLLQLEHPGLAEVAHGFQAVQVAILEERKQFIAAVYTTR